MRNIDFAIRGRNRSAVCNRGTNRGTPAERFLPRIAKRGKTEKKKGRREGTTHWSFWMKGHDPWRLRYIASHSSSSLVRPVASPMMALGLSSRRRRALYSSGSTLENPFSSSMTLTYFL